MTNKLTLSKKFLLLFLSLVLILGIAVPFSVAFADEGDTIEVESSDESSVRSFQRNHFMGIFAKTISEGTSLFTGDDSDRALLNYQILTGSATGYYSLYDRFGGNITVSLYLGEEPVETSVVDKIYTFIDQQLENEMTFDSIYDIITAESYTANSTYYTNRPTLKDDGSDPRVNTYSYIYPGLSADLGVANYHLAISNTITQLTAFFVSDDFTDTAMGLVETLIDNTLIDYLYDIIGILLPIFVVFTLIALVRLVINFLKGDAGFLTIIKVALPIFISIGLITTALSSPTLFLTVTTNIMTIGEDLTVSVLNDSEEDNEIVASSIDDNVITAYLWQNSVFYPWVRATFGVEYDELYTTYAGKDDDETWSLSSTQAQLIGDIGVPISSDSNDDVKNWAALAYSTSSYYHIPAVLSEREEVEIDSSDSYDYTAWPKASLVGSSSYIYVDDFRWIDALTKVGDYDGETDSGTQYLASYSGTLEYSPDLDAANEALIMGLLLLPLLYIGLKKAVVALACLVNFVALIVGCLGTLIDPLSEKFSIGANLKRVCKPVLAYFFYILVALAVMELYNTLATGEFWQKFLYACLAIYLCLLKPESLKAISERAHDSISKSANRFRDDRRKAKLKQDGIEDDDDKLEPKELEDKRRTLKNGKVVKQYDATSMANCSYLVDENGDPRALYKDQIYENKKGHKTADINAVPAEYRGANARINAAPYLNFKQKANEAKRKLSRAEIADYMLLINKLTTAGSQLEVFHIINDYRRGGQSGYTNSPAQHCATDKAVFKYAPQETASKSLLNYGANVLHRHDVDRARSGKEIMDRRTNDRAARAMKEMDALQKRREQLRKQKEPSERDLMQIEREHERLGKKIKNINRYNTINSAQVFMNEITGNQKGGSFVSPLMKIIIIIAILVIYSIGRIYATLTGGF